MSDDSQVFCFVTPCNTRTYRKLAPCQFARIGGALFCLPPFRQIRQNSNVKTISSRKLRIAVGAALLFVASCSTAPQPIDRQAYAGEIDQWRAKRLASLTSESGCSR